MHDLHTIQIDPIITRALEEDWGFGDWTTDICVPADKLSHATIIAKEPALIAGVDIAAAVFRRVDPSLTIQLVVKNGELVEKGDVLIEISGCARSILKAERVALNLFARMCGIATMTRAFVDQ
ncbi:MAG: nicotinate-nucleotide diphosphorylase (carboxylating), partial [Proteobacteria bacterium]|nr:nicotinate-nucleotide diphosphorylase (carboxylating) [Pseudomonadota bacterium]